MKIIITCHPAAGGSGILATELGLAIAERGHTVHFVSFESPFRLPSFRANVYSHTVSPAAYPMLKQSPGGLALAAKIADVAEEFDIDIVHAHYAIPYAASAVFARGMTTSATPFKVIATLHGTDITLVGADPSFFRVTQYAMEQSDAVTAVSHWLREETEREFALTRPLRTVHNFVDLDRFAPDHKCRCWLAEPGEKIVMHISNFRPVKRVTDVVRVFKKILERVPARLVMVGDGPERLSAVGVAKQLGVSDHIRYLGNQENIESIIPCADLMFQPSEHESFGLVALEAMASEVPVLATNSGGVREVVTDGLCGSLCEVGDIEAMAASAINILTMPSLAKDMGTRGRQRAKEHFSKDAIIGQYEQLYAEVLGGKG